MCFKFWATRLGKSDLRVGERSREVTCSVQWAIPKAVVPRNFRSTVNVPLSSNLRGVDSRSPPPSRHLATTRACFDTSSASELVYDVVIRAFSSFQCHIHTTSTVWECIWLLVRIPQGRLRLRHASVLMLKMAAGTVVTDKICELQLWSDRTISEDGPRISGSQSPLTGVSHTLTPTTNDERVTTIAHRKWSQLISCREC